jgi:coronin-1B/1C/6
VHGDSPKKEQCFQNVKAYTNGEGNFAVASKTWLAVLKNGGGGPVYILRQDNPERLNGEEADLNVHKGKILDVDFSPFDENLVATASEDGYAKVSQIPAGGLTEQIKDPVATFTGHQKKVMWCNFNPVASNVLMTAAYDHSVKIWDVEAQTEIVSCDGPHTDLIQSVCWNRNGSQILSTCKDKYIRLWDPRAADAMVTVLGHEGGKSSRGVFADHQNKLFVTGFSKTSVRKLRCYDPRSMDKHLAEYEFDQSAGVLMPKYDEDLKILWVGGKGDGNIRYFEIDDEDEIIHHLSDFRSGDPQKGLGFAWKTAVDTSINEIQRVYRVMKDFIEPIKFIVPRTSDQFQADLYPDTIAGVAQLTCSEWVSGKNAEPTMGSVVDLIKAERVAVKIEVKKSVGELEKELADALARIEALEAELRKYK